MSDIEGESDFFDDLSSDDELELELNEPRRRNENYLEEIVPHYSDECFFGHFRVSRAIVNDIVQKYEEHELYKENPGQYGNIPASHQVMIFMWYIGHQTASFRDIADRFNVAVCSVNRIIKRLIIFLSNLSSQFIKWPGEDEKTIISEHFRENGFPNVIGVIDGCHIKIDKPANDPDSYINRKGYYSIQLQAICDHRRKIIDLFVGYPGSVHDSRVFRNSNIGNNLNEKCRRYYILGDSGYPLRTHLLTPFRDRGNLTRRQSNYNVKLAKNRYVIEHCFGILKQKFRALYHVKLRSIVHIVHLIRAACVLHNISIEDGFNNDFNNIPEFYNIPDAQNNDEEDLDGDNDAQAIRQMVANSLEL